jgi:hypothetical protein
MKRTIARQIARREQEIARRLKPAEGGRQPRGEGPELRAQGVAYEIADRVRAISAGGIGVIHRLCEKVGLVAALDQRLRILKQRRPYSESDHVLNITFNVLCGGQVLDDIEVRRNDTAFLDAMGARTIPDPTTAGDFLRRFDRDRICELMDIINDVRVRVWKTQPATFFARPARIDADGSLVETTGECKEGMDVSYKGVWGYHPLIVTLANTGEPLFIVNRGGNRPSEEGAPTYFDCAIELCRRGGWSDILLRGDTAFSLTAHFDRWHEDGVRFVFGWDATKRAIDAAEQLAEDEYAELVRRADEAFSAAETRAKQPRVKESIVKERGFKNLKLEREDIAEFDYQPRKTKLPYRIVALRKTIVEERGQQCLGTNYRYFFYVTNDRTLSTREVVREANDRCAQEDVLDELKNGVRALRAPVNTLNANWAYMVIASLAWTIKAWFALRLPVSGRWSERHEADRQRVLRMEFRSFLQRLVLIPAQILHTGRRLVFRLLGFSPDARLLRGFPPHRLFRG